MSGDDDDFGLIRGSGNIFHDTGRADSEVLHLKAVLAARIIGVLDDRQLTVRRAQDITGFAAADFSRIRRARLDRFTIERLMTILARLDHTVEISVTTRPREADDLSRSDAVVVT